MKKNKIDKVIEVFRNYNTIKEDGIMANNVSSGHIAGTPSADPGNPPVDLRKKRHWNPFFKNLASIMRRTSPKTK